MLLYLTQIIFGLHLFLQSFVQKLVQVDILKMRRFLVMEESQDVLQWIFQMPSLDYSFVFTTGTDVQLLQIQI
jgi:hypothetical protein